MTKNELKDILSDPSAIEGMEFEILRNIAVMATNRDKSFDAHELILRALEHGDSFRESRAILESLIRMVGLFPYVNQESLSVRDLIAYEFHRPLNMKDHLVFHREQAEIYHRLLNGENVILSAPTSFGKSLIIDALIATGRYGNVAVIVPTLALIDETRRRLQTFSQSHKIVTHLSQRPAERNIFVFTAERAIAYEDLPPTDLFVIDEFYKINALEENDTRTVALNLALQRLLRDGKQFYMLGPNVERVPEGLEKKYRCYFYPTQYNTVVSEYREVPPGDDELSRLVELCRGLGDPTLIFCRSPNRVNQVAARMLSDGIGSANEAMRPASEWAAEVYHREWIWSRGIGRGIGIHHGKLPRSLAHYTVRAFNDLKLNFLICTSTLIEGVNTKAKNVVIFDNRIAQKKIDYFTFNNIKGRSGRMDVHFIGNVYLFSEPPQAELPLVDFPLLSQEERVPDSLLVNIDEKDLRPSAKERVNEWIDQGVLPIEVIRANKTIEPKVQVDLAQAIFDDAEAASASLSWDRLPNYDQLRCVCRLVWILAGSPGWRGAVSTAGQLAYKINRLRKQLRVADRIAAELEPGQHAAKSADEAVERVLDFERVWASFEFPRYLMAVSRIQESVLKAVGLPYGDFSHFASQVECFFSNPVVAALDEYGIPVEVAKKVQDALGTENDLDLALKNLREVDTTSLDLHPFERELIKDAVRDL